MFVIPRSLHISVTRRLSNCQFDLIVPEEETTGPSYLSISFPASCISIHYVNSHLKQGCTDCFWRTWGKDVDCNHQHQTSHLHSVHRCFTWRYRRLSPGTVLTSRALFTALCLCEWLSQFLVFYVLEMEFLRVSSRTTWKQYLYYIHARYHTFPELTSSRASSYGSGACKFFLQLLLH